MERECPKCGFKNTDATGSSTEACPKCSVIYAKATLVTAQQRIAERQLARKRAHAGGAPPIVERLLWILTMIGAVAGLLQLAYTMAEAESAPQQAAGAAVAVAMAVIPYCLARAVRSNRR